MRVYAIGLVAVFAAGCTTNDVSFEHQSQVGTQARGVAFLDDERSNVGMSGNTCMVDPSSGMISEDYDVAVGEMDSVQDGLGTTTLVVGDLGTGVYVVQSGGGGTSPLVNLTDVVAARFSGDGSVAIGQTDGTVNFVSANGATLGTAQVDTAANFDSMSIDPSTGVAYIPQGDSVAIVDSAGGVETIDAGADVTAFDPVGNVLYVAELGSSEVRALEVDGTLRWAADVGGPVASIDDMQGQAAVMVGDDSWGELVILDGATGAATSQYETPSAANEVIVSDSGHTMAMVLDNTVHYFAIRAGF